MYYPKQIPYLLERNFKENISYHEYRYEELSAFCMCIWQMKSKNYVKKTAINNILPDACIDVVIDFVGKTICFAGFSKETIKLELDKKIDFMGVRFKPGAFSALFGVSAERIMDQPIDFMQIDGDEDFLTILETEEENKRLELFVSYLKRKLLGNRNLSYINLVDDLYSKPEEKRVREISLKFGYDKRHLYRLFKKHYGVSPKVLLNILRLHLCLTLLLDENRCLDEVMERCGFYDQAHFIKEIKRYTGFSPLELLKNQID